MCALACISISSWAGGCAYMLSVACVCVCVFHRRTQRACQLAAVRLSASESKCADVSEYQRDYEMAWRRTQRSVFTGTLARSAGRGREAVCCVNSLKPPSSFVIQHRAQEFVRLTVCVFVEDISYSVTQAVSNLAQ